MYYTVVNSDILLIGVYMTFMTEPLRIEEEIFDMISYGAVESTDEFTLNRYYHIMMKLKETTRFDAKSYGALGRILYNMKKFQEYMDLYKEGSERFHDDLMLQKGFILGLAAMSYRNYYDLTNYDIFNLWFNKETNPERNPFGFLHRANALVYAGNTFDLVDNLYAKIMIGFDKIVHITTGPLKTSFEFKTFRFKDFQIDESITYEITERIRLNKISSEETRYLKYILDDRYDKFIDFIDPDFSELLNVEDEEEGESYNSVDELMESLMI